MTLDVHEGASLGSYGYDRPLTRALALSPDGRNFVYVAKEAGRAPQLYLRPMGQDQASPIPGTEYARFPSFSPDGQWIAFFRGSEGNSGPRMEEVELMRVPVDGGEARTISMTGLGFFPDGPIIAMGGLTWTDEDTILLTSFEGVLQVPANGGEVTHLTTHDLGPNYVEGGAQLLEGGRAVLYVEGQGGGPDSVPSEEFNVIVESLETRDPIVVVEGGIDPTYLDSGLIVFVRSGTLMAVPFDAVNLEVTGDQVVVLEDLMQTERGSRPAYNTGIGQYSISDSGTLAYLTGGIIPELQNQLNWVDMDGNAEPVPQLPPGNGLARFSPDGTRLAYTGGAFGEASSTWVYDINLEIPTRLPKPTPEHENAHFAWSPDGTEIVFSSRVLDGPLNLYLTAADGSGQAKRLTESDTNQYAASWSSNGVLVFLEGDPTSNLDIMVLSMDGDSEPKSFRETPFRETHPAFSPDGHWLAYASDETGRNEVQVRPFPTGVTPYPISNAGGKAPVWSANGDQLFYRSGTRFMEVAVPGGSISARSPSRILFGGRYAESDPVRNYDVSPDGDRFVIEIPAAPERHPATRVNIIQNWFEELTELVPVP